jgi:hypothetical protein
MPTPDPAIVAHPTDSADLDTGPGTGPGAGLDPIERPQTFTIRCMECADTYGSHLPNCPDVIAAGYDTAGRGAFSSRVYPAVGSSFCVHENAFRALDFYSRLGPVALHLEDGRVVSFLDLDD